LEPSPAKIRHSSRVAHIRLPRQLRIFSFVPTRTYGFAALFTRSSSNYGPYQFPERFLPLMITNMEDDKPLPIYGDGKQQRDWLHVEDNCRGILAVLEKGKVGEVYNLGGLHVEENLNIARRLLRLAGKPEILLSYVRDRPGHDRRYALDCQKIMSELGWCPAISLEDGLRRTIDWYRKKSDRVANVRDSEYLSYYKKYYDNRDSSLHEIVGSQAKSWDHF
jgi:dTDP-glucose 4,6-dehydratase